jgi:hypothetical protein
VPWTELRQRAGVVFRWLQDGWESLSPKEREEVRKLLVKSKGRPRNLTKDEARRLGALAGQAASAAARARRKR